MSEPMLQVVDLKMHFHQGRDVVKAVDGVTFQIHRNQTFGLVGESGSGKSTLARAVLRLHEPTAGSVYFEGRDVGALSSRELRALRREMQIVFQDPLASLNPMMSVGDIVGDALKIHRVGTKQEREQSVGRLLDLVGVGRRFADAFPHEFSGGQQQRVAIARALALQPQFVICDEPVSSLDLSIQAQILNLLESLQKRFGLAYLFISHDLKVRRASFGCRGRHVPRKARGDRADGSAVWRGTPSVYADSAVVGSASRPGCPVGADHPGGGGTEPDRSPDGLCFSSEVPLSYGPVQSGDAATDAGRAGTSGSVLSHGRRKRMKPERVHVTYAQPASPCFEVEMITDTAGHLQTGGSGASCWGYNQSNIVRAGEDVYALSWRDDMTLVVFRRAVDGRWEASDPLPPVPQNGNLLVDGTGRAARDRGRERQLPRHLRPARPGRQVYN